MRRCCAFLLGSLTVLAGTTLFGQSFGQRFRSHNLEMSRLQPALISPLVGSDPRLLQYVRFSVSHQFSASGAETLNWGNCRGAGVILLRRFELDWAPPLYLQHYGRGADGWGDTSALLKVRLASANAESGNFAVSAIAARTFATGSHKNGALTGSYTPTLAAAWAHQHFDVIASLGATLPAARVTAQGRTIAWNTTAQLHATRALWLELGNNATFYKGGSHDGSLQNFLTPGAFYVLRKNHASALQPTFILDAGMQIATSGFHTYNHNLITEVRILF
ncbi:hypothetical protein DYQ86_11825 [Acidobacteria bacterium AB60]|nr:hypothetical protein DYQ86_11825 [Acidobacteria bacterium AB60]